MKKSSKTVLLKFFNDTLNVRLELNAKETKVLEKLFGDLSLKPKSTAEKRLVLKELINRKFNFHQNKINGFLSFCAEKNITFNYHEKEIIQQSFDCDNAKMLRRELRKKLGTSLIRSLLNEHFSPFSEEETIKNLHNELKLPTLIRKDSRPKAWAPEILRSIFGGFIYHLFEEEFIHQYNDEWSKNNYIRSYWKHLQKNLPDKFSRSNALTLLVVNQSNSKGISYEQLINKIFHNIESNYSSIVNHGYLAVIIEPLQVEKIPKQWRLVSDITLYAEKHRLNKCDRNYFRWKDVEKETSKYISHLDVSECDFDVLQEGFYFIDNYVFTEGSHNKCLLLFQKNEPDEDLIPCPACRSHNIQGNSYSSLGVKSWECKNWLCPDRSKFNRGKRYSFNQLLKQESIKNTDAIIGKSLVRQWARDVQKSFCFSDALEMLLKHYTLPDDGVFIVGTRQKTSSFGRRIKYGTFRNCRKNIFSEFYDGPLFRRYHIRKSDSRGKMPKAWRNSGIVSYHGDAHKVLRNIKDETVDVAVTSPPYYNAREYSQWDNIYTYLYDMYNIAHEVFRVLKPGSAYCYNVFDYFDNERNITFSALGKRRMTLGAYAINSFEEIGFICTGNTIWDKGHIEGKRAFNAGNFSPFYQSPFNCWEHILIFVKPPVKDNIPNLPHYLPAKPVMKMVKGNNTYGHTAPFPKEIPELAISQIKNSNGIVLDPFAGSMTTGVVAAERKVGAIMIELNKAYFDLGNSYIQDSMRQGILL